MPNRRKWGPDQAATLQRMEGQPDAEIAKEAGFSIRTVREYRRAQGIRAHIGRANWSRRDWLLADAAGLDFSMSLSVSIPMCSTKPPDAARR